MHGSSNGDKYDDDGNETLEIEEFVALFHDNFYGDFNEEDDKKKDNKDALYGGIWV